MVRGGLRTVQEGLDKVQGGLDKVQEKVNNMSTRIAANENNAIARMQNAGCTRGNACLVPLNNVHTNTVVENFPGTVFELERLSGPRDPVTRSVLRGDRKVSVLTTRYHYWAPQLSRPSYRQFVPGFNLTMPNTDSSTPPNIDPSPSTSTVHLKIPYLVVPSFKDWAFPYQYLNRRAEEAHEQSQEEEHGQGQADQSNNGQRDHYNPHTLLRSWLANWHQPGTPVLGRCVFERNAIAEYRTHYNIDQSANKINLYNDTHAAFNDHWFTIAPKSGSYAIHVLSAIKISVREFSVQFYNVPVLQLQLQQTPAADIPIDIPPEFLYARFAWAVLLLLKPFVAQSPVSRRIARYAIRKSPDNRV
ncbi:hypothetical protein CHU98_g1266 [Xylaria longipes]|nr:hypothetical protein CHU98_g1266 [Xylaria longipes]